MKLQREGKLSELHSVMGKRGIVVARPQKWRRVEYIPPNKFFAPCPQGRCEHRTPSQIQLKVEELEAMRLKDIERLSQEECAARMRISRQTFQNILEDARRKVVTALLEDRAIAVGGGHYTRNVCHFKCLTCGDEQELIYEERRQACVHCGSHELVCTTVKCDTKCDRA